MKLTEKWWKKWSVHALAVCIVIAEVAAYLPEVREFLPPDWYRLAFIIVLIARVVAQKKAEAP